MRDKDRQITSLGSRVGWCFFWFSLQLRLVKRMYEWTCSVTSMNRKNLERRKGSSLIDKPLFTPGPLTTSRSVKESMLRDLGSRDIEFIQTVASIREQLLKFAGVSTENGFESVLMQGSGTFGVESVCSCAIPPDRKMLVAVNGSYGERIAKICQMAGVQTVCKRRPEDQIITPDDIASTLDQNADVSGVAVVHCETTTGILNPIEEIGRVVRKYDKTYIVDSMSAFGGIPFDFRKSEIDFLVSSANKCIEGVPGFSFVIARRARLLETQGRSRSLSLDLYDQWETLERTGQFRFTPPTHTILAFRKALSELEAEGGIEGRAARYRENFETLRDGMKEIGFKPYLAEKDQSYIINSFLYPDDPKFTFDVFYHQLNERGFVIYPGKVSNANCFRIGSIGRINKNDITRLLQAIRQTLAAMNVSI